MGYDNAKREKKIIFLCKIIYCEKYRHKGVKNLINKIKGHLINNKGGSFESSNLFSLIKRFERLFYSNLLNISFQTRFLYLVWSRLLNLPSTLVNRPTHILRDASRDKIRALYAMQMHTPSRRWALHSRCTRPLRMRTHKAKRTERSRCIHDELTEMHLFRALLCDLPCAVISFVRTCARVFCNFRNISKKVKRNG